MDKSKRTPPRAQPRVMARRVVPKETAPPAPRRRSRRGQVKLVLPSIKTRPRWRRVLRVPWLRLALFLAALGAAYYLFASRTFAVQRVEALGDAHLPLSRLEQECHCIGKNIFLLQPDAIRRRLAAIPTLVVDDVYGRLPNRLIVEAHFKRPDIIWHGRDGYFLADARGELIARAVGRSTLPVITVDGTAHLAVGQLVDAGAMLTVHDLIRYLPRSLRATVKGFHYSANSGITITTKTAWSATFGWLAASLLQERIIILQFMLQQARAGTVPRFNYADLRFSSPFTRYDKTQPPPR